MIKIKSSKVGYGIKFPSDLTEITPDILNSITAQVKLPKYHCVVALAFKTTLFDFCATMSSKSNASVNVTPILAKINEDEGKEINACVGDKIIIDRSSLERGVHLNLKTAISSTYASNYFAKDKDLAKAVLTKSGDVSIDKELNNQLISGNSPSIVILEFKICAVNDIAATIDVNVPAIDPFTITNELN